MVANDETEVVMTAAKKQRIEKEIFMVLLFQ
jgi:hypothetical protein